MNAILRPAQKLGCLLIQHEVYSISPSLCICTLFQKPQSDKVK